ncbi:MAG: hypothetical protein HY422_00320 [Candidatus Komeilibacteria bacterium]|nr:hypothetical protein [Candidatus Komeilibacteria bacterium]
MDLSLNLLNPEMHMVGPIFHFRIPKQGPLTDLILGCDLEITSVEEVRQAQTLFEGSLIAQDADCDLEDDFQVFEFKIGTRLAEAIGLLIVSRHIPCEPAHLFGWESYYRRFRRHLSWDMPAPYPMPFVGSPGKAKDGVEYVPFVEDQGHGRHRFGIEPFAPRLPYVPESESYYLLARRLGGRRNR